MYLIYAREEKRTYCMSKCGAELPVVLALASRAMEEEEMMPPSIATYMYLYRYVHTLPNMNYCLFSPFFRTKSLQSSFVTKVNKR